MPLIGNLEAMLSRGQDSALLRYGLGKAHLDQGQYDAAVEHLKKALELDPRYSAAWKLLGQALAMAKRDAEAIRIYQDGIEIAERNGDLQAAKEMKIFLKRLRK
ncbi:MAG: tetratricopeptide repeat protein [Acidiferrobacterales bacterium]